MKFLVKRVKYGDNEDRPPDGTCTCTTRNDDKFGVIGDDSLLTGTDGCSSAMPRRQRRRQKSARFLDAEESGYVTPTESEPSPQLLSDEKEAGMEWKATSTTSKREGNGNFSKSTNCLERMQPIRP